MAIPEMKVRCSHTKLVAIADLKRNAKNRNIHPPEQIKRLAAILAHQGWRYPVKVSNQSGIVSAGQGRIEAAEYNKWTHVPVDFQDYDSPEQEYQDQIADNAIASWSELDLSGIHTDIGDLGPFDLDFLGIKDFELTPIDQLEPGCDEDHVPEPKESICKLGNLWILGNHRLLCGDSTSIDAVERLMGGEKADLWLSDPPYGVNIKQVSIDRYEKTGRGSTQSNHEEIGNDIASKEGWGDFLRQCFSNALIACSDKSSHYVFTPQGSDKMMMMMMMMQESGWNFRHELIWRKNRFILGRSDYHYQHEPILYGWKTQGTHEWNGGRDKASIIDTQVYKNDLHPTMKPIELLVQLISNSSHERQKVLDLFLGSGSTLIACEKTGRKCYGMELDPHYCDVIIARFEKFSGKKAVLSTTPL